jgi:uncharacterized protein
VNRRFLPYLRLVLALLLMGSAFSAEVIPPKPVRYFNDYAGVTSAAVRDQLNAKLEQLEKTNSTQVVVAIFKDMQTESSIDDYTLRIAQNWGVGQKDKSNGAILFVFINNRKMFLQVGYGLEGAIPDITAKDITENRIKPHFKNGDYNSGMIAGVDAIIQAAAGEYKGTGRTVAQGARVQKKSFGTFIFVVILLLIIMRTARRRGGHVFGGRGRTGWGGPIIWTGGSGWGGGGRSGWGGGGGGGGFSGGGGSFGGGGAGSDW